MSGGRELNTFYVAHFTYLRLKENNSKRKIYSCNYCSEELEHRENRLANHISSSTKCHSAPAAARTAAHVLVASKKSGAKRAAPEEEEDNNASNATTKPPPNKKPKTQLNLDGVVDRPMTTAQEDSANRKLLRYLIHSNTAFLQADSLFLADFANELRPSFKIASRTVMSTLLLDSEHSRVHLESVDALQEMKRSATLILDGWEDELRRSLYGAAAGRVGEPTVVMGLQDVTGKRGNAEKLLEAADTAMSEMGIEDASCFLGLVTDNPNVMKAFRRLFGEKYPWIITLACWAHQLNTLVGEICRYAAAKAVLQKANRVVTFFNGSHYWGGQLKAAALAEKITRGLKKNCESRWYALILLAMSVSAHHTPLSVLVARPDARKPADGLSPVNADIIRIVKDIEDDLWPWLERVTRVARPFVDAIAASEGRAVTLADCMLNLLSAARQLSLLDVQEDDSGEFLEFKQYAERVVDKRFRQMATPIHRFTLFLHPLCRKFVVLEVPGFTLRDYKHTALQTVEKWGWKEEDGALLASKIDVYAACKEPFAGGQRDALGWWRKHSAQLLLQQLATGLLGLTPHSAEIERLFSMCNGIQSPKRNSLGVETFSKLAKVRSNLVEEARSRTPPKKTSSSKSAAGTPTAAASPGVSSSAGSTRVSVENTTPLDRDELLESWETPMEGGPEGDERIRGVDAIFEDLDRELEEEEQNQEEDDTGSNEGEEAEAPTRSRKHKKASELSLMAGDIYDFALVKQALDNVVPQEEVQRVNVVKGRSRGGWNIEALL